MQTAYDVIVVGGGPAGSTAAHSAAAEGAKVLVLDAAEFPRLKPCGGGVSEQAMSYLGFPIDERLVHAEIFGARVHFGTRAIEARRPFRIAVLTTRSEFDQYLLRKAAAAGARIVEGTRVQGVTQEGDFVSLRTAAHSFRARYVIGADGAQSTVSGAVRPKLPRSQYAVTYEFDLPCTTPDPAAINPGVIDIHFGGEYMGYKWVFSKRGHWNIGVGALASRAPNVKKSAANFLGDLRSLPHDTDGQLRNAVGWIVPAGGYRRPVGAHRILLAGDAAGFVDPFYGEGIAYAIKSGGYAGIIAGRGALGQTAPHVVQRQYRAFCRSNIESNLWYGLLFSRLLHMWPNGLLRVFSTDARLLEKYLDVPAARMTYRDYVRWFLPRAGIALPRMFLR